MNSVRHKVFVSYHHEDQEEVDAFIETFDTERDVFISRGVGIDFEDDIINSDNTDYVMRRIRELYLQDSTVTIVLIGKCTWARKYVDWELQSSLRSGATVTPNGLLGIKLPSFDSNNVYPDRLNKNLKEEGQDDCYARCIKYPTRKDTLATYIEDAFKARSTRINLINNPRDRFTYNRSC